MIVGDYPCCGEPLMFDVPDDMDTPLWYFEVCELCGARLWHYVSRLDPCTYLEADFLAKYRVDEDAKVVEPRSKEANHADRP